MRLVWINDFDSLKENKALFKDHLTLLQEQRLSIVDANNDVIRNRIVF